MKAGQKSNKLEELERIKAIYEMKDCTFKPNVRTKASSKNREKSLGKESNTDDNAETEEG